MLTLALKESERAAFSRLRRLRADEQRLLRLYSAYLNEDAAFVTPTLIRSLMRECGVGSREAFCALLEAAFGLEEGDPSSERIARDFLPLSVRRLDPAVYRADPYFRNIRVPCKCRGNLLFVEEHYAAYEGFVCGDLLADSDGFCEIAPLGYFEEPFSFPALKADGIEWMAIKPNEIETMRRPLQNAHGRVLAFGLGLGYYAYMASEKEEVTHVTVVERDSEILSLFCEELLPQFAHREKIELVQADAFAYAANLPKGRFDSVFVDLWHDVSDGFPLYLRMRRLEREVGDVRFDYWIEDHLLSHLRTLVFEELSAAFDQGAPNAPLRASVGSMAELRHMLTPAYLRDLAPDLRPAP